MIIKVYLNNIAHGFWQLRGKLSLLPYLVQSNKKHNINSDTLQFTHKCTL